MLLATVPTTAPTIAERADDFDSRARTILFSGEDSKLAYIHQLYAVDDGTAREILHEAYVIGDQKRRLANAAPKAKAKKIEPRCGQCGRPFDTWREAWEHESRAHAMEQRLFARVHS
jgi:hypothetical protein